MSKLIHHLRQYKHNNGVGTVPGYDCEGTEKLVHSLESDIAELKEQITSQTLNKSSVDVVNLNMSKEYNAAMHDARELALSLHAKHYDGTLDLCDTPTGVISQIDNMVCGLEQPGHLLEDNNRKAQIIKILESQVAGAHAFALHKLADVLDEQGPESFWPRAYKTISAAVRTQAENCERKVQS